MKKLFLIALTVAMSAASFAQANFTEIVAGSVKIKGEKVGVLSTTIISSKYKPGMPALKAATDSLTEGLKVELINKGASVMTLSPEGMEQILADFIEMKKGQFSTKEVLASNAGLLMDSGMKNAKAEITTGIQLLEKLLETNEFSGEVARVDNYAQVYRKIIELWGISKLITVTRLNQFSVIVKGYDLTGASAALTFQYEVRATKDSWNKMPQWKEEWKITNGYGFTVEEDMSKTKYEASFKRQVELIKRVAEFLK